MKLCILGFLRSSWIQVLRIMHKYAHTLLSTKDTSEWLQWLQSNRTADQNKTLRNEELIIFQKSLNTIYVLQGSLSLTFKIALSFELWRAFSFKLLWAAMRFELWVLSSLLKKPTKTLTQSLEIGLAKSHFTPLLRSPSCLRVAEGQTMYGRGEGVCFRFFSTPTTLMPINAMSSRWK